MQSNVHPNKDVAQSSRLPARNRLAETMQVVQQDQVWSEKESECAFIEAGALLGRCLI